jgi:hypothetical protein
MGLALYPAFRASRLSIAERAALAALASRAVVFRAGLRGAGLRPRCLGRAFLGTCHFRTDCSAGRRSPRASAWLFRA